MIIDFHTHIVPPRIKEDREELARSDACFGSLYADPRAKLSTADELIQNMNREKIDKSVVLNMGWSNPALYRETNDYIMEAIDTYPDRLIGFCTVHPKSTDAVLEIERCAKSGMRGIGEMMPHLQNYDLGDKYIMWSIAQVAEKYDLIFLTHSSEPVGHSYPGKGNVYPNMLCQLAANFPKLKIVCAHWGGGLPFYSLMPEIAATIKNIHYDTAASPFLYSYDIFPRVADLVGADKILFGSDYPLISQRKIINSLQTLQMPRESIESILGRNALDILGLE